MLRARADGDATSWCASRCRSTPRGSSISAARRRTTGSISMTTGAERIARLLLVALALGPLACRAAEPGWNVAELMRTLAQVKIAKGRFVERRDLAALTAPLRSSGTLLYVAPGHLEKHTLKPAPESLVLEGDRLTVAKLE